MGLFVSRLAEVGCCMFPVYSFLLKRSLALLLDGVAYTAGWTVAGENLVGLFIVGS
jgi:hypothetical protein